MEIPLWIEKIFFTLSDTFYKYFPQKIPQEEKLKAVKFISHRGHHDNLKIFENTLSSFTKAEGLGAWGIELDIRWAKDDVPIIIHDPNLLRVFGKDKNISDMTFKEIRESFPLIPTLKEVIDGFGKNIHLMLELKNDYSKERENILKEILGALTPCIDYHLLSLDPEILKLIDFIPERALIPVAEINIGLLNQLAFEKNWGGVCGHYLLTPDSIIKSQHKSNRLVGTGHVASKRCLYREVNRGVDWIFTNDLTLLVENLPYQVSP